MPGDTNASWVRIYDASWNLPATANSTLNLTQDLPTLILSS